MTLTTESAAQIQKDLGKAGIRTRIERPSEQDVFEIRVEEDGNRIQIYPAVLDLRVFPDKRHKQAIMWADEKGHTVERDIKFRSYDFDKITLRTHKAHLEKGQRFPIGLPEGTVYTCIEGPKKVKETSRSFGAETVTYVVAKVKATVPNFHWTFLLGTDEKSHFISALPKRVKSIDSAHKSLRPRGITALTTRQGEWFFVPATAEQSTGIEKIIAKDPTVIKSRWLGAANDKKHLNLRIWAEDDAGHGAEDDTSHAGLMTVFYKGNLFASGYVIDDRRPEARPSRHDPLWLYDWHKVVHNLEIVVPGMDQDGFD